MKHNLLEEMIEERSRVNQQIDKFLSNEGVYQGIVDNLFGDGDESNSNSLASRGHYVWRMGDHLAINLSGTKDDLVKVFRVLARYGMSLEDDARRPQSNQPEWNGVFYSEFEGKYGDCDKAHVNIYFTSTVCRRVQVGTEIKEVPVYEIKCEEV